MTGSKINLKARTPELCGVLASGVASSFDIYDGWDKDVFHAVGKRSASDNRVELTVIDGQLHADCDCTELVINGRICGHVAAVVAVLEGVC